MNSYRTFFHALIAATIFAATASIASAPTFAQTQPSPQMREQAQALGRVCMTDIRKKCQNVQFGGGQVLACLQDNVESLSQPCKDALAQAGQFKASGR